MIQLHGENDVKRWHYRFNYIQFVNIIGVLVYISWLLLKFIGQWHLISAIHHLNTTCNQQLCYSCLNLTPNHCTVWVLFSPFMS